MVENESARFIRLGLRAATLEDFEEIGQQNSPSKLERME